MQNTTKRSRMLLNQTVWFFPECCFPICAHGLPQMCLHFALGSFLLRWRQRESTKSFHDTSATQLLENHVVLCESVTNVLPLTDVLSWRPFAQSESYLTTTFCHGNDPVVPKKTNTFRTLPSLFNFLLRPSFALSYHQLSMSAGINWYNHLMVLWKRHSLTNVTSSFSWQFLDLRIVTCTWRSGLGHRESSPWTMYGTLILNVCTRMGASAFNKCPFSPVPLSDLHGQPSTEKNCVS